jgi:hypothetical protein
MRIVLFAGVVLALVGAGMGLTSPRAAAAESLKLQVAEAAPPAELAEGLQAVLGKSAVRLLAGDKPVLEFWFRKEVPLPEAPSPDAFVMMAVKEGTLLGAARVSVERRDFKDEEIPPGVYVLRLGLQPEDGDHQGTAPTRTFALLTAAAKDRQLESLYQHDALVKISSTINAAKHPSNLNLQPIEQTDGEFPRLVAHNDGQHLTVYLRLPAKVQGQDGPHDLPFALVYQGKGQF